MADILDSLLKRMKSIEPVKTRSRLYCFLHVLNFESEAWGIASIYLYFAGIFNVASNIDNGFGDFREVVLLKHFRGSTLAKAV